MPRGFQTGLNNHQQLATITTTTGSQRPITTSDLNSSETGWMKIGWGGGRGKKEEEEGQATIVAFVSVSAPLSFFRSDNELNSSRS